ncbi:MAG TPA: hypothetical protein VFP02_05560 [Acidimicrobiales bacterium]|nr:hypothetical protein [Acidimicrobiales bacterium]
MIKRLFWLALGITVGVLTVLRTQRSLRRRADRLRPERMATDLADAIRALGVDLRKAVAEGRTAMSQREAELNEQLQARTGADT